MITNEKEVNVRFVIPEDVHKKVLQIQGLFAFKEGKKTNVQDMYIRLIEKGILETLKKNR